MTSCSDTCAVCVCPANDRCARCHVTSYCSRDHQKQHWKQHKKSCRPYTIGDNAIVGRHLVATRDLQAGDIILKDMPLMLGPRQITMPVCVGCSIPVSGSNSCTDCGWPICNPECQQVSLHQPECQASRARGSKVVISKFYQLNEMYECITPLRCLALKKDPLKWDQLMSMQSHTEERKAKKSTELDKCNVIDFIRGYLKYQDFVDEEVYKICGILEVNGFEIPAPNFVGLYGQACLLEHSCVPNSSRTFDEQMNVIIRSAVDIKKGDHITTSYTDPMWGTYSRRLHLNTTKYFTCQCPRCLDPTELDSHYSSIKCQNCEALIPPPLKTNQDWCCPSCNKAVSGGYISKLLKTWGSMLANLKGNIPDSEEFLKNTVDDFADNHHYRTDVKLALAQLLGKQNESQLSGLKAPELTRKLNLCKEVLVLVQLFNPGLSRLQGLLQFETAMTMWEQHRRMDKNARTNKAALQLLQDMDARLSQAAEILSYESCMQEEYEVAQQATEVKELVQSAIKKCNPKKK